MSEQLTLVEEAFGLTIIDGESLQLTLDGGNGPSGPAGAAGTNGTNGTNGAAGPNTVTTATTTNLTGYIYGNGTNIAGATAAASAATPSTLVRRTSDGNASFAGLNATELAVGGSIFQASSLGNVSFGSGSVVNFDALTYNYALGGAAALAHRTALGSGATGDALFTAASASAARTTLLVPASDPAGVTGADAVSNIISLTQAEYDAIGTKSATTLYVVT